MGKERRTNLNRRHVRHTKLRWPKSFKKPKLRQGPKKPKQGRENNPAAQ